MSWINKKVVSNFLKTIFLISFSLLIGLIIIELFSRYYVSDNSSDHNYICKWSSNISDSELCRLKESLNSKELTMSSKYETHDICDLIDFSLGWRPRKNCVSKGLKLDYDSSKQISYNTNSLGARGTREVPYERDIEKFRILFIGDSFTFGEDVSDNNTYPEILQKKLGDKFEVINLGVHGYGLGQSYLYLKEEGIKYKPDLVILGLFMPDIIRDKQRVFGYFKPKFGIDKNSNLIISENYIPTIDEAKLISKDHYDKFRLISLSKIYFELKRIFDRLISFRGDLKISYAILEEIKNLSSDNNFKFSVLYIPTAYSIEERSKFQKLIGYDETFWGTVPKIKLFLSGMKIDFIDPLPELKKYKLRNNVELYRGHTTPEGNQQIANEILSYLKEIKKFQF